jgi:hypothetical protein
MLSASPTVVNPITITQHYADIGIAQLAYDGTPLDSTLTQQLQQSVDLTVSGLTNLAPIAAIAPATPQLIYTNVSNIYLSLLTNWLNYADSQGISREDAFYHVAQATPFSGAGGSSQPVDWFWAVYSGGGATWTNLTSKANGSTSGGVTFATPGNEIAIGYPDPFREINVNLAAAAAQGWSATLEYPTAVDSTGKPLAWGTLTTITNTTANLTQSGQITFDPPANWKPASLNGSALMYYVRFRTTTGGTAPVALTILGRDFVNAAGGTSGVIPAFDSSADKDNDGYLNDAEYANRKPGFDARFLYESRLFYFTYGQMRFATNPANESFDQWAISYDISYLASNPLAAGLFIDNSSGLAPASAGAVLESVTAYNTNYAELLADIDAAIAPHWILANTAGGGTTADPIVQNVQATFDEAALQALATDYPDFQSTANLVATYTNLASPGGYLVLDSTPTGGSMTDPRTQLATLAEYYLLANPPYTFLDLFGGSSPASSWSQHFIAAETYNIGLPTGTWSVAAKGVDPTNATLKYRIYQRSFANALVLYKPLSYGHGVQGTTADATATTFNLGGTYYLLNADGTLGPPITSISLRNGEGAILIKASNGLALANGLASSTPAGGSPLAQPAAGPPPATATVANVVNNPIAAGPVAANISGTNVPAALPDPDTIAIDDQVLLAGDQNHNGVNPPTSMGTELPVQLAALQEDRVEQQEVDSAQCPIVAEQPAGDAPSDSEPMLPASLDASVGPGTPVIEARNRYSAELEALAMIMLAPK